MTSISVYIVGPESVFKEGVKSLLAGNGFTLLQDGDDPAARAARKDKNGAAQMVVALVEEGEELPGAIARIKTLCPHGNLIMICDGVSAADLAAANDAGVAGLILKDISCAALISSLKLIAAGKKIYPRDAWVQPGGTDAPANTNRACNLSRQEMKIVHCLMNGDPNKIIARHLGITEATVKVHVRTVLRKFGAANRTQAAITALARGLGGARPDTERFLQPPHGRMTPDNFRPEILHSGTR